MRAAEKVPAIDRDPVATGDAVRPCLGEHAEVIETRKLCATLREKQRALEGEITSLEAAIAARLADVDPVAEAAAPLAGAGKTASQERSRLAELREAQDRVAVALGEAESLAAQAEADATKSELAWARGQYLGIVRDVLAGALRLREALAREPIVRNDLYRRGFGSPPGASLAFTFESPVEDHLDRLVRDAEAFLMTYDERSGETVVVLALCDGVRPNVPMGTLFEVTRAEAAALGSRVDMNPKARPFRIREKNDPTLRILDTRTMGGERVRFHSSDTKPIAPIAQDDIEYLDRPVEGNEE